MEEEQARDLDTQTEDQEPPKISPSNLISTLIFLSDHGLDVNQIVEKTGVTPHRIRQILRDQEAIRQTIEDAAACQELPGFTCTLKDVRAPRKPIKHKPRGVAEDQDDQTLSLFEEKED